MLLRIALTFSFCTFCAMAFAADPPAAAVSPASTGTSAPAAHTTAAPAGSGTAAAPSTPAPSSPAPSTPAPSAARAATKSAEEFAAQTKAFNDLIAEMTGLQGEHATTNDSAKKAEIAKKFNADREKAAALADQLIVAAKKAYEESPNADPEVTRVLVGTLADQIERDDYEPAFDLGKMLIEKKCPDPIVPALAGIAAYCVNQYDLAGQWLKTASALGSLQKIIKNYPDRQNYPAFLGSIDEEKAKWEKEQKIREAEDKAGNLPQVSLKTNKGEIVIELFENEAPNTVLSFITLVDKGFYDGVKFHRVLPGFMAQGGDPKGDGTGGPGYTIPDECFKPNHRLHFRGSVSMAHTNQRDSGGSQFFLCFIPTSQLDGQYTVFGRIVKGMDVLAKLRRIDPQKETSADADKIIEARVIRRPHAYDAKDLKKSSNHD